jgi:hypothetical protein
MGQRLSSAVRSIQLSGKKRFAPLRDLLSNESCVRPDSANQGGGHPVLKPKTEKEQPGRFGNDAPVMSRIAIRAENRKLDPAVVGHETGAPNDNARLEHRVATDR